MSTIVLILFFLGLIAFLIVFYRLFSRIYAKAVRASDKYKMKAAIEREAYLNELYEETLFEEMDKAARKTAKDMSQL